jgi:hypothetical protein
MRTFTLVFSLMIACSDPEPESLYDGFLDVWWSVEDPELIDFAGGDVCYQLASGGVFMLWTTEDGDLGDYTWASRVPWDFRVDGFGSARVEPIDGESAYDVAMTYHMVKRFEFPSYACVYEPGTP